MKHFTTVGGTTTVKHDLTKQLQKVTKERYLRVTDVPTVMSDRVVRVTEVGASKYKVNTLKYVV